MSPLIASQRSLLGPAWAGYPSELWRRAKARPSLDLRLADNKSLADAVTGQNLVTFTRASSGTFVGSDGLIKTATTNLLLRSEEFDNASWSKTNCSITVNAVTAPNGALAADKIVENTATTIGHYVGPSPAYTATAGLTITYSVYAKAAERTFVQLVHTGIGVAGGNVIAGFDLTNGTAGTPTSGATSSIIPVGDGWYRCSLIYTPATTASTLAQIRIALNPAANPSSYTGDGSSGLFLWGAQLEQSPTVGEYIPTTSVINSAPRFDHNPTTGESLGLLVEEQRTNLLVQSNGFDTTWANANTTETAASGTAPDGTNTAWLLTDNTTNSGHTLFQSIVWSAGTFTATIFAKYSTHRWIGMRIGATGNQFFGSFDLQNGVASSVTAGASVGIDRLANGWYRLRLTATLTTAGTANFLLVLNDADTATVNTYAGTGTSSLIWGAQLETGAFPTSYIPTTTATVTRSADVASITGSNFSSWYRQDEGTVFARCQRPAAVASNTSIASFSDGTTTNTMRLRQDSNGTTVSLLGVTSGTNDGVVQATAGINGSIATVAGAAALNNYQLANRGVLGALDSSALMPTVDRLEIGAVAGIALYNGTIQRLTYWKQRLPDSTLQAVTQ